MTARTILLAAGLFLMTGAVSAGDGYRVTARGADGPVEYDVTFGDGRASGRLTAFDPASRAFVYLTYPRSGERPTPVGSIWDHRTGATIPVYKFPKVETPLPAIPSIGEMKVCPLTGDTKFTYKLVKAVD